MSQQPYSGLGGSPYENQGRGGATASSNPYGNGDAYGGTADRTVNPYGGEYNAQHTAPPALHQQESNYSQESSGHMTNVPHTNVPMQQAYQAPPVEQYGTEALGRDDFFSRIEGIKQRISQLSADVQSISTIHQRMLSSPDNRSSSELENVITQTQIRNTQIKDEIKFLEKDASRQRQPQSNEITPATKRLQIKTIKNSFKTQLELFQKEESDYGERYREAIGRQYRIINPDATDAEVQEAQNADWGEEGVFTQALKSNRSGQASSVLGAVRARHNDIQRIAKTMQELSDLFVALNEQVVYQEPMVAQIEIGTTQVHKDAEQANVQLDKGIDSARRARKLKWYTLLVVFIIIAILALVLGIYFGAVKPKQDK